MPSEIGYVDNGSMLAHYAMLDKLKTFAEANGWVVLRYDTVSANREVIFKGAGFSGVEEIFIGFRCYHDVASDYYNLVAAAFTGYVPENTFYTQPGAMWSGVPAHNQRIDYWLSLNAQRIVLAMKVGTPVYESAYVGKFLPYARPSQYPYPVVCAGMLDGSPATRFSDTAHSMSFKGNRTNFRMRFNSGAWLTPKCWPWNNSDLANSSPTSNYNIRPTDTFYPLLPVVLMDSGNVYGELDGVYFITGFNNVVENTLTIDGKTYVVIQDVGRTSFPDYFAMRLD